MGQPGQPVQHPMVQPQGAPVPGRPVAAPGSLPNAPAGAPGLWKGVGIGLKYR